MDNPKVDVDPSPWMTFIREVLKDSRPMTDWERKTAADIFWSEFE